MSRERSRISGGGTRVTERGSTTDIFGNSHSYTHTDDYDRNGKKTGSTCTDSNGDIWNRDSTGRTTHRIGNDGRFKK